MPLRLITAADPTQLLEAAADGFLTPNPASPTNPFPSPGYLLALRQGTLRDDLMDLAAQRGIPGWFDTPLCIFHELPARLGVSPRETLGEYERAVLLGRLLRTHGRGVFAGLKRPDIFVDAVDSLFGELISNGVAPEQFAAILEQRDGRDEFERRRDGDLARTYAAYLALLDRLSKGDGRDEWQYCAAEISAGRVDLAKALGGRREIRIFGLADLRRGWGQFLAALANHPAIDQLIVYTTSNLDLGVSPERITEPANAFACIAAALFDGASPRVAAGVQPLFVSAPDVEREHAEVARRIRMLIDGGAVPNRIAVVSRKARPHVDYAIAALERAGVPAMARQRFTLAEVPAIRVIRTLFKAAADGWTRAGLVELARQPYIDCAIDPRVINHIGFRRRVLGLAEWENAIRGLETEARTREARIADGTQEADDRAKSTPKASVITETREAFGRFAVAARTLDKPRPIHEWLDWLSRMFAHDTFGIRARAHVLAAERFDIVRRDLAALDGAKEIVRQWSAALTSSAIEAERDQTPVTLERFHEELSAFLSGDAAIWTQACQGVQILEGPAAAYREFDHVFLLGMQAGAFPALAPQSPILEESERSALVQAGLPLDTADVWDERERELFRVLLAGARRSFTLSYARLDELGREVTKSSFVEALDDALDAATPTATAELPTSKVVIEDTPLFSGAAALEQAVHGATIERLRAASPMSAYDGRIQDPELVEWLAKEYGDDRHWSPTQLEEFAKCPWAYFSKRALRLELQEDPDEDMDPATRGSVLHLALRHFYDAARAKLEQPVFLMSTDWPWAEPMLSAALDRAIEESSWKWLGHPVLRAAQRAELWRILHGFVEWEMELHHDMTDPKTRKRNAPKMVRTGADVHELGFEDMIFERDGVRIRYRGSIDRVDVSVDERTKEKFVAAIDYKTSQWSTPGAGDAKAWDDGVVLQVPLYAHALQTLRPGYDIARVEYQTLKKPSQVHSLQLYTIDKKSKELDKDEEATTKWQAALDHAIAHVKRARNGEFPAGPPPTCNCAPWCHGRDICRVAGGPREL